MESYLGNMDPKLIPGVLENDMGAPEYLQDGLYDGYNVDDDGYYDDDYGYYGDEGDGYNYDDLEQYADDDMYYERITSSELLDRCILPTLSQACSTMLPLLGLCFVSRITMQFVANVMRDNTGKIIAHSVSAMLGLLALHWFFRENVIYLVMLAILSYILICVTNHKCPTLSGVTVALVTVVYLITCELLVVEETEWHQIRGAQMVLAMKIISLAFDLSSGSLPHAPGFIEFVGYTFQVGTVIFGPWVSFADYARLPVETHKKIDFYWVARLTVSLSLSLTCVMVSTCVVHWLVLDTAFLWLLAYRDAQSFRFSHYFISYLSELTATMTGLGAIKTNGDVRWELAVTRPFCIELPRSLVEVVTNWNLPMHHWLRTYVFKNARSLCGNFVAIILTYAASSVLHGLNFQLSAVLVSLGFHSYVEFVLRRHLSSAFSACIEAKRCKPDCDHQYKSTNIYVMLTNVGFGFLAVFHLAYLGLMFDSSANEEKGYGMEHTLSKWSKLGYASHWVALASFIFYLLS